MPSFTSTQWITLQQPLLMVASMLTGKDVAAILAMEVHERVVLLHGVSVQLAELFGAAATATDPTSPGGVTLTEAEVATIIDEADDVPEAVGLLKG